LLSYSITDLGTLGGRISLASGINASGQVVGESINSGGELHAFLYSDGKMIDLGTLPGGHESWGYGINASGQVVGMSRLPPFDLTVHAFLYRDGVMTDLGTPGGPDGVFSVAYSVNASGNVAGTAYAPGTLEQHAFLYSQGTWTDLGTLGGNLSAATGINASGRVVGSSLIPDNSVAHAFLYGGGTMTDLGTLGDGDSQATAINDSGQVVGFSRAYGGAEHAFLYGDGTMTDIDSLGSLLSYASAVNDSGAVVGTSVGLDRDSAFLYSGGTLTVLNDLIPPDSGWTQLLPQGISEGGQIVGTGLSPDGQFHAFLLTPDERQPGRDRTASSSPDDSRFVLAVVSSPGSDAPGASGSGSAHLFWDGHVTPVPSQQRGESQLVPFSPAPLRGPSLVPRPDATARHAPDMLFALEDIEGRLTEPLKEGTR
jgi:probable HAF family extracellular repeat protein